MTSQLIRPSSGKEETGDFFAWSYPWKESKFGRGSLLKLNGNNNNELSFMSRFYLPPPTLCIPACDMKFSGLSSSRPRHCPPDQTDLLRRVAGLRKAKVVGMKKDGVCASLWPFGGVTRQTIFDSHGRKIFELRKSPLRGRSRMIFHKDILPWTLAEPRLDGFKVEVKDPEGLFCLSFICQRFWFAVENKGDEIHEMQAFLGKYELPIGKIIKMPPFWISSERKKEYYFVYDEKGDLTFLIHLISAVKEEASNSILSTFTIKRCEGDGKNRTEVGRVKFLKLEGIPCVSSRLWFGHDEPALLGLSTVEQENLPIIHKCLLIGALILIVEKTPVIKPDVPMLMRL